MARAQAARKSSFKSAAKSAPAKTRQGQLADTILNLPAWAWVSVLLAIPFCVYCRTLGFAFLYWDDDIMIFQNPWLVPLRAASFTHFWHHPYYGFFAPLLYHAYALLIVISHWLHPELGNALSPVVFHAANLGFHLGCVAMLFVLLRRLDFPSYAAFLGALLLAVHPTTAEPVSFTGSLDTPLVTFLSLLCLWQYTLYAKAKDEDHRRWIHFGIASLLLAIALFVKPVAIALPLIPIALELFLFRRPIRKFGPPLLFWIAGAAAYAVIARQAQFVPSYIPPPVWQRPFVAGDAVAYYLVKLFFPYPLALVYGRTPQFVMAHWWGYFTWLLPAAVAFVAWKIYPRFPYLAAGFCIMVAGTLPMLGFFPFNFQQCSTVSDRYMYLAMIGPALVLAGVATRLRPPALAGIFGVLLLFGVYAGVQAGVWRNSETLYKHSLSVFYNTWNVHSKLGDNYARAGDNQDALIQYQITNRLAPDDDVALCDAGSALRLMGRVKESIPLYVQSVRVNPSLAQSRFGLGLDYAQTGQPALAVPQWQALVQLVPDNADYRYDLGMALFHLKRYQEAAEQFYADCRLRPGDTDAQQWLLASVAAAKRQDAAGSPNQ